MVADRRKHERCSPEIYLTVHDCLTKQPMGKLVNLSPEGAMLVTSRPIRASTSFRCRVELPHRIMGHNDVFFNAECRWCRKNVKADRWESGYRLNVTGIDAELVQYLILGFKLCDWGEADLPDAKTRDMENRRRSDRHELCDPLPVFELRSYRQIGKLADLSMAGFRIITQKPIGKDDMLQCRVKLPKKIFQQDYLTLGARCMWCRKRTSDAHYESGHKIVNISEDDASVILHVLIHFAKAQQTKRRVQVVG